MNKFFIALMLMLIFVCGAFADIIMDDFVDSTLKQEFIQRPEIYDKYDYSGTAKYPLKLALSESIKSEKDVFEGQQLEFIVKTSIYRNHKVLITKGTKVSARIETIIKSGMNGLPASIIIGDFQIEGLSKGQFTDFYEVKGQDRSLWVFPLKWALTILPPTGSLTNFIKGGHAKLKTTDHIIIYYYPDWL